MGFRHSSPLFHARNRDDTPLLDSTHKEMLMEGLGLIAIILALGYLLVLSWSCFVNGLCP